MVKVYSPEGKDLFTMYLSTTYAVDIDISEDNKYLAVAEIDYSRNCCTKQYKNSINGKSAE